MAQNKSTPVAWILTISIAAAALYYSLRGVDWAAIASTVSRAESGYLGIVFAMATLAVFIRSVRWRVLLSAEDKIPVGTVFWATSAGYLANSVLPARAGEVLRTQLISARSRLSRSYVFATALTGMAMDMIVLVVLSAFEIATLPGTPAWLKKSSGTLAAFGLVGMIVLFVMPHCEPLVQQLLAKVPGPDGLRVKLTGIGGQFLLGLRAFHHVSRFALFVGISFSVWVLDAFGTVLLAKSLHLSISFEVGILLLAGLAMASAAPSTPGYVGIYQIVAVGILPAFGLSKSDAIAYILVFQAMAYAVFIFWGLVGLWMLRRPPTPEFR